MPVSQNGYSANDRSMIASYTVPGTTLKIALRKGDVSVILLEYLRRYHVEVESLYNTPQDLWGYAERTIIGSTTTLSNHASGSACDARAVKNGLGKRGTFTPAQEAALNRLLAWFEGVIRHGKDYTTRPDPMHAEIDRGPAEVARIANKIRAAHSPEDDLKDDERTWLGVIYDQITGQGFKGWPTWPGGTNESMSLVDYARRDNVEVRQLHANLASAHQKLDQLGARLAAIESSPQGGTASNVTAASVVDELLRRLKEAS